MSERALRITYWVAVVLFAVPMMWSALQYFTHAPKMVATMTHLGYPLYFLTILGVAKVLGVVVLVVPGFRRLKEWAFAGFTFNLIGATWSHLASGDGFLIAAVPLGFLAVLAIAYAAFRQSAPLTVTPISERLPGSLVPRYS